MPQFDDKVVIFGPAYPLNLTPIWVANDKGFFAEEGLDVELRPTPGIPDNQHPRFQWRREGMVVFQSPAGSPPFRSVRENRERDDMEVNVISIANRTAHVFVARPEIADPSELRGKRLGVDSKGGSNMDARIVLRHYGVDPEEEVTYVDSCGLGELVRSLAAVGRHGGSLKLVNLTSKITDLLVITKLLTVFDSYDSEAAAVNSFK